VTHLKNRTPSGVTLLKRRRARQCLAPTRRKKGVRPWSCGPRERVRPHFPKRARHAVPLRRDGTINCLRTASWRGIAVGTLFRCPEPSLCKLLGDRNPPHDSYYLRITIYYFAEAHTAPTLWAKGQVWSGFCGIGCRGKDVSDCGERG
jgi:hypothetical protein